MKDIEKITTMLRRAKLSYTVGTPKEHANQCVTYFTPYETARIEMYFDKKNGDLVSVSAFRRENDA